MKKLIIGILLSSLVISSTVGCNKIFPPSPKNVLNKYLDDYLKGRYEEAYKYISSSDKSVGSLDEYLKNEENISPFAMALASLTSYKILKVNKKGKTAQADVEITMPDTEIIFRDVMSVAFASVLENKDEKQIEQALAKKYKNGNIPTTTQTETFQLVKEQDGWKVFFDLKTEKIREEKQSKIQKLLNEAEQLEKEKKLYGALDKYQQILNLDNKNEQAEKGIDEIKKKIKEVIKEAKKKKYKINYIKEYVKLYDLKAYYTSDILDGKTPCVEFKLKNEGKRTLKEVDVTVYFKDSKNNVIAEKTYYPVLVSEFSFLNNEPLKPNYIWQLERGHCYKADSVPDEWKEGAISVKITNIEFMN